METGNPEMRRHAAARPVSAGRRQMKVLPLYGKQHPANETDTA